MGWRTGLTSRATSTTPTPLGGTGHLYVDDVTATGTTVHSGQIPWRPPVIYARESFACLRLVPHLQGDEPYAELTDIYVEAPFRRQGVARALIAQVEAAAQAAGASEVVLITGFDNLGAQAAYRASGYAYWALAMRKRFPEA